jgi:hypothetical protein
MESVPPDIVPVMSQNTTNGQGDSALEYQDGQTINLPRGWKMEFLSNWDSPYLQAYVLTPDGENSASLNYARHEGTTSCDEEIELPRAVYDYIMREQFDEYA